MTRRERLNAVLGRRFFLLTTNKHLRLSDLLHLAMARAGKVVAIVNIEFIAMQGSYCTTEFLLVDRDPKLSEFLASYLSERGHPCNASLEAPGPRLARPKSL